MAGQPLPALLCPGGKGAKRRREDAPGGGTGAGAQALLSERLCGGGLGLLFPQRDAKISSAGGLGRLRLSPRCPSPHSSSSARRSLWKLLPQPWTLHPLVLVRVHRRVLEVTSVLNTGVLSEGTSRHLPSGSKHPRLQKVGGRGPQKETLIASART